MDKKYTDKFIPLKDDEINALSKLKKDSTFDELKKVDEMKKILDTIKEIYKLKISLKSLRYLKILSTVRKFQLNAFKDLPEVKRFLAKNIKEKLTKRRGRGAMRGKGPKDTTDKAISDSTSKETDLVKKLTSSLEKALRSDDPVKGALKALATWAQEVCVEKLGKPALKSLEYIFNNPMSIPNTLLGWAGGKWVMPPSMYKIIDGVIKCIGSALVSTGFVLIAKRLRDWWSSSVVIARGTPRRDEPSPNMPDFGSGGGPPGGGPPPPPSAFDRQQRNRLNELFRQQQQNIESGIIGAGGGSQLPPQQPTQQNGFSFSDYFSNLFSSGSQPPSQGGRAGSASDESPSEPAEAGGAGATPQPPPTRRTIIPPTEPLRREPFAPNIPVGYPIPPLEPLPDIQFGGQSEPTRNQFGGGIPSGNSENTQWDPFNIIATAAYLKTLNTFFNPPQAPQPEPPTEPRSGTPPMELPGAGEPPPPMELALPRDDGLGFEDDFERERFEMDEAERARQEAEQEDEEMDRKLPAIEPPESSVAVAGSLFTGGKAILASSFDAVRAAQLASKIFDQMASAVNQVETIDESLELKETIAGQQVIEGDIQQNLIRQMVEPVETNILDEEMAIIEGFVTENLEIIQSVQNGTLELDEGIKILQSTVDYINNVLSQIPKDESPDETSRLKILRTTILQSIQDLTPSPPPQRSRAPPRRTNIDLSLKQIEDFRAYINREVEQGRVTPQQASEVLSNMLLQKDAEIALQTSARYIKLNKEILDDIDKYNELRGQGGALIPSREPSLDSLYTSSVPVPTRVEIKPYISPEESLPRLTRRAPGALRRELTQMLTEPLRAGAGAPNTEFSRFFGFNEGGPNAVRVAFLRIMREKFSRDGTQLWNEFMTRFNNEESLSVQNKAKLSAQGKKVLIQMIKKYFGI